MDQNENTVNQEMQTKPKKDFRLPIAAVLVIVILTTAFACMMTYVSLSLDYQQKVEEAYGRFAKFEKLIEVAELYDEYYLYDVDDALLAEALAEAYVYGNGDRFSSYYNTEAWAEQMANSAGNSVGIGVYVTYAPNLGIRIVQVMKDGPASKADLQKGDVIVAIDGQDVTELDYEVAVDMVKGEVDSSVVLTILRGEETLDVSVVRGHYVAETVYAELMEADGHKFGYINITEFLSEEVTAKQFKNAVETLRKNGAQGLVFDVRDNPGGDLNAVCSMLDYLVPQGPIVRLSYANTDQVRTIYSYDSEVDMPMVVLTNNNTASAAELFTSALRDYDKAKIIGQKTYGKGCGQTGQMTKDGSVVFITNFLYSPPYSDNYDGIGIVPDYEVALSEEWQNTNLFLVPHNDDAQFIKAVEVLLNDINS